MIKTASSVIFCLCFTCFVSVGQNTLIDSLHAAIAKAPNEKEKAELFFDLAEEVLGTSVDTSLAYIEKALAIGRALKDFDLVGRCLVWKGRTLGEKNALDSSLSCLDEAEAIFSDPLDEFEMAKVYNAKGIVFRYMEEFEKAIEYQYKSAELAEKTGNFFNAATTYNSIANIYIGLRDKPKAAEFYEKSIAILEKSGDGRALAGSLLNYANILDDDPQRKMAIYDRAEKIALKNQYNRILAYIYSGKGDYFTSKNPVADSAQFYLSKAVDNAKLAGDAYILAYSELYLGIQQLDKAPALAAKLIERSMATDYIQNDPHLLAEGNFYLSQYLTKMGRHKAAYILLDTALTLYKKVYDEDVASNLSEANARFETSKKEAQLAENQLVISQQKSRQTQLVLGSLLLLALTAGVSQYFFYQQKKKKQAAELALQAEHDEAERLRQLDEMKTTFFTNVSYELRTPLTLIISPLEEVLKKLKQVNLEDDLSLALRNSKNLLGLVNEVLDLSKMEAGQLESNPSETALQPWLRRVFFSFQSGADLKEISLDFQSNLPEGLTVKTDTGKLEKVLNNLVSNALKFTPKGGQVELAVSSRQSAAGENPSLATGTSLASNSLLLTITDTGPGIHPDDLPHVFDRFFQSKNNRPAEGGTGIGLALAKQLARRLGGDLTTESEMGKGSRFVLEIPMQIVENQFTETTEHQNANGEQRASASYQPIFLDGKKPRILIVEDNAEMANYLKNSLSKNYDCTIAADGEAALKYLHGCGLPSVDCPLPDLITSDVMMPQMDGFALREKINEREDWRKIPFILLTARTLEADKLKGFQLGIDDYVTKPFSLPELEARVHNLLKNKQLREAALQEDLTNFQNLPNLKPDEQLLQEAEKMVLEKMDDPQFSVEVMAKKLGHSQRQLARIFGRAAGLTPVQFILEIRLQRARQLLESHPNLTVAEVRYEVGIESASYFTKKFTERFGKNPSGYSEVG